MKFHTVNVFRAAAPALLCALSISGVSRGAILYSDDFDVNTSANYTVTQDPDTTVAFSYDYSVDGIPSAPGSLGGSTRGVKFTANNGDATAAAAAINISPTGQSFTGDYTLRFYSWLNANGPFPGGGAGSTEFATGGIGVSGTSLQKSTTGATGTWFAGDGEGNSGIDYRAYTSATLQGGTSTVYLAPDTGGGNKRNADNTYYHTTFPGGQQAPASQQAAFPGPAAGANQTGSLKPGTLGFVWRKWEITKSGNSVSWVIDGLPIATFASGTFTGTNVFVGHWDVFASITDNPAVTFGIIDNLEVEAIPEPASVALIAVCLTLTGLASRRRHAA